MIPFLNNFAVALSKLKYHSKAYLLLEEADSILNKILSSDENQANRICPVYKYNRMIVCAVHVWSNLEVLLKSFGIEKDVETFVESWQYKKQLLCKHRDLVMK